MCRGEASRGLQSPFFVRAPVGGTPLCLNHGPGLQSWEALCAGWVMIGRDRPALCAVLESGLKSAASGHPCPGLVSRQSLEGTLVAFCVRAPLGHTDLSQSWPRTSVLGGLVCRGLLLGGIGQAQSACSGKRTEVHAAAEPPF